MAVHSDTGPLAGNWVGGLLPGGGVHCHVGCGGTVGAPGSRRERLLGNERMSWPGPLQAFTGVVVASAGHLSPVGTIK